MQSKIIFVVLFMLSFSVFHDSFMPLLEKNKHTDGVHYVCDTAPTQEYTDCNEMHIMLHFMAIVTSWSNNQIHFAKKESIPHLLIQYTSPLEKSTYKPPIA